MQYLYVLFAFESILTKVIYLDSKTNYKKLILSPKLD